MIFTTIIFYLKKNYIYIFLFLSLNHFENWQTRREGKRNLEKENLYTVVFYLFPYFYWPKKDFLYLSISSFLPSFIYFNISDFFYFIFLIIIIINNDNSLGHKIFLIFGIFFVFFCFFVLLYFLCSGIKYSYFSWKILIKLKREKTTTFCCIFLIFFRLIAMTAITTNDDFCRWWF